MNRRWKIDDIREKGLKIIDTTLKVSNSTHLKHPNSGEFKKPVSFALGRMKAGKMNKTEAAYAKYLETQKQFGDVEWYEFEPMNLRLADKCFYAIDFLVMLKNGQLECHEVKGYWTDDALVKIKAAAAKFPFRFISVKLVKGSWEIREF